MVAPPTPDEVRALIRPLDELDRKVLGGLVALFMVEPEKVRDPEWSSQAFVQVAVVAHGAAEDGSPAAAAATSDDVERIRSYARERMPSIMSVAVALLVRVAEDLRGRAADCSLDDARALVGDYLTV